MLLCSFGENYDRKYDGLYWYKFVVTGTACTNVVANNSIVLFVGILKLMLMVNKICRSYTVQFWSLIAGTTVALYRR